MINFSDFNHLLSPDVKSCVVIPVKNEEEYIVKTLTAFKNQVDIFGKPLSKDEFEILILANNCTDNSVHLIKTFQVKNPEIKVYLQEIQLPKEHANIGYVRRILMDAACKRLEKNGGGIIMTTDGDTEIANDWIAQNILEIEKGADAVGGRILLRDNELNELDEVTRFLHLKDEKYQLLVAKLEAHILKPQHDPFPRHHQHFNGSFAITTGCYRKSGGIPDVKNLEDCAFFERLQRIDAKIRHSFAVKVHTSARCIGRTEVGLAYQLNEWKNLGLENTDFLVESAESIISRLLLKKELMALWKNQENEIDDLSQIFNKINPDLKTDDFIFQSFRENLYFGDWYEILMNFQEEDFRYKHPKILLDQAIFGLEKLLEKYSVSYFSQTSIR